MQPMTKFILAKKGWSWASGKTLAKTFRANKIRCLVTENVRKNIAINWGNSSCIKASLNSCITTNKFSQIRTLKEAGIPVLTMYRNNPPREEVLVARDMNHQAGKDIVLVRPEDNLPAASYYTLF